MADTVSLYNTSLDQSFIHSYTLLYSSDYELRGV